MRAWRELDKATPELDGQPLLAKIRVRHDHVDRRGAVTLRYRHKLHHIGVGRPNRGRRVINVMADLDVRVIDEDGVLLRLFELDPKANYQAKTRDIVSGFIGPRNSATSHLVSEARRGSSKGSGGYLIETHSH